MANKLVRKFFGNFKGLDLGKTHLNRDPEAATEFTNVELTQRGDIATRRGCKLAAQYANASAATYGCRYPMWGLETYTYENSDGVTTQELIGVGNALFKLVTGQISIVYTGAGTGTFSFLVNPASNQWEADLKIAGVSAAGFPLAAQNTAQPTPPTLATLRNAINSIANCSCFLTPAAVVNGNQTVGYRNIGMGAINMTTLTVYNAIAATTQTNTITVSAVKPTRIEVFDRATSLRQFTDVTLSSTTSVILRTRDTSFQFNALDEIGVGLYPIMLLPITAATNCKTTPLVITFSYWERIFQPGTTAASGYIPIENRGYFMPDSRMFNTESHNFNMKNNSNVLYIGMPFQTGTEPLSYQYSWAGSGATEVYNIPPRLSGLMKYDSQSVFAAGLPRIGYLSLALAAGAGLSVGTYKYVVRYKCTDEQGNITYSTDTTEWTKTTPAITTTGGNQQVTVVVDNLSNIDPYFPYGYTNGAQVAGNQVGVNTIAILFSDAATNYMVPTIRVGDTVRFLDRSVSPAALVARKVTAVNFPTTTTTTITIAGAAVNVNNADFISTGLTLEIFRTKVGGSAYYLVDEIPTDCFQGTLTLTYLDIKADTALGYEYDGPFTGNKRKDLPPILPIIENHQGLLVGANGDDVYWSNDDSPECFPVTTNYITSSNTVSGPITALASDNVDNLAVFKDNSYFNVTGDLLYGGVTISDSGHGDVGCPSPFGIAKIRSYLMIITNKGPVALKDGSFLPKDNRLAELFSGNVYTQTNGIAISATDRNRFVLKHMSHWHDIDSQKIYFCLPREIGTPGSTETLRPYWKTLSIYYDYNNDLWGIAYVVVDDNTTRNMAGGGASVGYNKYILSRYYDGAAVRGMLFEINRGGVLYDYCDDTEAIVSTWQPQWDFLAAPSMDKYPVGLRVYSLYADSAYAGPDPFISNVLSVTLYKNFSTSTPYGSKNFTITSAPSDGGNSMKLPYTKVRAFQPKFSTSIHFECMRISAYEVLYAIPYKEEDLEP